jgi:hypothetical protein
MDEVGSLKIRLVDQGVEQRVLIDSVEFTRDPGVYGTSACPTETGSYKCEATGSLSVKETLCLAEPTGGICPAGSQTTQAISPPVVDPGESTAYSGWQVHVPAGWVIDHDAPTTPELGHIADLCLAACELEWSDRPEVSATCADSSAILAPVFVESPGLAVERRIPDEQRSGGGLFSAGQELTCDLEGECCSRFDEHLCAAGPTRTTTADVPLGRGEESSLMFDAAASKAKFVTPGGSSELPLTGTVGFSLCPDGDTAECPFYVGSMELTGLGSTVVTDTCPDGSPFTANVEGLDIELVQPAFGMSEGAGSWTRAMPIGSLHTRGTITVNGMDFTVRATNEDPVYFDARSTGIFLGDLEIDVDVPCGTGTLETTLEISLAGWSLLEQRPTIVITSPSLVECPGPLSLTANASDPDGDLEQVRWYVDDVPLAPGVNTIAMTEGHELRAVATDERGASQTATKAVSCKF